MTEIASATGSDASKRLPTPSETTDAWNQAPLPQKSPCILPVLAIDPGPTQSAFVIWDGHAVLAKGIYPNEDVLGLIPSSIPAGLEVKHLAVEMVQSFGMAVGAEVFQTVWWTGRFCQAWITGVGKTFSLIYRKDEKMTLCHSMRAKDCNIRQAIIDRFGGKDKAIGLKKTPGPLYGLHADEWSALSVALTFCELERAKGVQGL